MRLPCPFTLACTGRKLMFQRRFVTLWAWLMRFPACGFLPQISHCCAIGLLLPNDSDLVGQTSILQEVGCFRQCRTGTRRGPAHMKFLSPLRGLHVLFSTARPRLAPWAAFFRRSSAHKGWAAESSIVVASGVRDRMS